MSECTSFLEEELALSAFETFSKERRDQGEEHILFCSSCRDALEADRMVRVFFRAWTNPERLPGESDPHLPEYIVAELRKNGHILDKKNNFVKKEDT